MISASDRYSLADRRRRSWKRCEVWGISRSICSVCSRTITFIMMAHVRISWKYSALEIANWWKCSTFAISSEYALLRYTIPTLIEWWSWMFKILSFFVQIGCGIFWISYGISTWISLRISLETSRRPSLEFATLISFSISRWIVVDFLLFFNKDFQRLSRNKLQENLWNKFQKESRFKYQN